MHELDQYSSTLPTIEDFIAGDDRTLAFQVVDADGNGVDIQGATLTWALVAREYESGTDAVLDESDASVTIDTADPIDPANGEWEVNLDGDATADLWGEYFHRPKVEASDGSVASWRGEIVIEA